jgi:NhaB family Na+:H+ antiporter
MILNLYNNFLGTAPKWYKNLIILFLVLNPIIYIFLNTFSDDAGFILGWLVLGEFILTLAMALKCYPLQPGGLIAIETVLMGLTNSKNIYHEVALNLKVILLLVFMVAGIYFMKDFLLFIFTKLLVNVKNKRTLSLLFLISAAVLSAFLDALTVTAVLIAVAVGFYALYQETNSNPEYFRVEANDISSSAETAQFQAFLRDLLMHGAVGTALGGVSTIVGEPQNLLIGSIAGWDFIEFFMRMLPISLPVFIFGLGTCYLIEKFKICGYGAELSDDIRSIIENYGLEEDKKRTSEQKTKLFIQFFGYFNSYFILGFECCFCWADWFDGNCIVNRL